MKEQLEEYLNKLKAEFESGQKMLAGVEASYAPVMSGNLPTTSDTPGYVMKAQPVEIGGIGIYRPGTVDQESTETT